MHMAAAAQLIDKAANRGKAYAVFMTNNGDTKVTGTGTNVFVEACEKQIDRLVGVYDAGAEPRWIVEDVEYMRSKRSCAA